MKTIDDGQRKWMFVLIKEAHEAAGSPGDLNAWRHEQQERCGVATLSDCTVENYQRLRVHFEWIIQHAADARKATAVTSGDDRRVVHMGGHPFEGQLRKVYALLTDMSLPWEYADGMAQRMYGQKRTEQLKPGELRGIIAALTTRQQKHGGRREPAHV